MRTFRTGRMAACVAAAVMAFFCVTDVMADGTYESDGIRYYLNDNSPHTATVTGCDKSLTSVVIPTDVRGYSVTAIGFRAFKDCTALSSVTLPNSVIEIDSCAFQNCTALISVNIPNSVEEIEGCAFQNCVSLTSITIPGKVYYIGKWAFSGCLSLITVTFQQNENLTYYMATVRSEAFSGCVSLTTVTFLGYIDFQYGVFNGCNGIVSAEMNSGHFFIPPRVCEIIIRPDDYFHVCKFQEGDLSCLSRIVLPDKTKCVKVNEVDLTALIPDSKLWSSVFLYVPRCLIEEYKKKSYWCNFKHIMAIEDM